MHVSYGSKFQAVGCGDIMPQDGTWIQRDGDKTTLGCQSGRHSWTLECLNNQWVGAVGSCGTGSLELCLFLIFTILVLNIQLLKIIYFALCVEH